MSLRRIVLRDFVIVPSLDLDLDQGFNVLTGETGAGKSILIDALQLALGARADSGVVREGATRCEIAAEFDLPASLRPWLDEQVFAAADDSLLLRRTVDTEGRSRGWINGSAATMAQLKALADHLVDPALRGECRHVDSRRFALGLAQRGIDALAGFVGADLVAAHGRDLASTAAIAADPAGIDARHRKCDQHQPEQGQNQPGR